jgi:hypothetical protein
MGTLITGDDDVRPVSSSVRNYIHVMRDNGNVRKKKIIKLDVAFFHVCRKRRLKNNVLLQLRRVSIKRELYIIRVGKILNVVWNEHGGSTTNQLRHDANELPTTATNCCRALPPPLYQN